MTETTGYNGDQQYSSILDIFNSILVVYSYEEWNLQLCQF